MLMDDRCFRIDIGLRLNYQIRYYSTCACGEVGDQQGRYYLSCSQDACRYFRLTDVNSIINKALVIADILA